MRGLAALYRTSLCMVVRSNLHRGATGSGVCVKVAAKQVGGPTAGAVRMLRTETHHGAASFMPRSAVIAAATAASVLVGIALPAEADMWPFTWGSGTEALADSKAPDAVSVPASGINGKEACEHCGNKETKPSTNSGGSKVNSSSSSSASSSTRCCGSSSNSKVPEEGKELPLGSRTPSGLPVVKAVLSSAPQVPPPIDRTYPVHMLVDITSTTELVPVSLRHKYPAWTFNGAVPGPMIRCRVGDELHVRFTNYDKDGIGHNIDFHAITGPGGGAPVLYAEQDDTKAGTFKMLYPGAYIYHCAAAPVPMHIANGMYGLLVVEPEGGLPEVDKEFYVLQSEFYAEDNSTAKEVLQPSYWEGLRENATYVVFNGREGALTEQPLMANQGERVRLFVGNAGPNLVSSFHIIGCIFDKVYREGDLITPPARGIQTTLIPAGGAAVVEMELPVPGNFTLVDHSIFRMDKGAIGFLKVKPSEQPDQVKQSEAIYKFEKRPLACPGCKLH